MAAFRHRSQMLQDDNRLPSLKFHMRNQERQQPAKRVRSHLEVIQWPLGFEPPINAPPTPGSDKRLDFLEESRVYAGEVHFRVIGESASGFARSPPENADVAIAINESSEIGGIHHSEPLGLRHYV